MQHHQLVPDFPAKRHQHKELKSYWGKLVQDIHKVFKLVQERRIMSLRTLITVCNRTP